jgi:hypothetical protein
MLVLPGSGYAVYVLRLSLVHDVRVVSSSPRIRGAEKDEIVTLNFDQDVNWESQRESQRDRISFCI